MERSGDGRTAKEICSTISTARRASIGAQMCLRSGWMEFLKGSIDRVLKNHPLDGVYYDWNVALLCCNPLHEMGRDRAAPAQGHWDIDELLDLMEWTRNRVGPNGVVIVHNTTTPMFATENFADYVVATEWGYGKWTDRAPDLQDLPLEWSLVGAVPAGRDQLRRPGCQDARGGSIGCSRWRLCWAAWPLGRPARKLSRWCHD